MTANDLMAAFEVLAEAPDGLKRLRELVLQLAVRGRLVEQDPTDQPATRLLGGRTVQPSTPPWDLPQGWAWSSIDALGDVLGGGTPSKANHEFWEGPIPWVSPKDMKVGWISDSQDHVSTAAVEGSAIRLIPAGAVLMVVRGMILAHSFPVAVTRVEVTVNQDMKALVPFRGDLAPYLLMLLQASRDRILAVVERSTHGTCKLPFAALAALPLAIAPLAEQHRIVARVDELMGILDRLEGARTARDDVRCAARDAALAALREADDADAVEAAWGRIAGQMDALFAGPEDVGPLRQAVLGLAVKGRLVRPESRDGTGDAVLRDVGAERSMLVEKGLLRRGSADVDSSATWPFAIPVSWRWARAAEVTLLITDGDHQPPPRAEDGHPFVVIGDVSGGWIDLSDTRLVSPAYFESLDWTKKPTRSDLLYTVTGSFGLVVLVRDEPPFCVQRHIGIIKSARGMSPTYLMYALRSDYAQKYAADVATGIAQKTVPLSGLRSLPIPIPPLALQHRIVAKVEALMAMCDALEGRLSTARDLHQQFAAAAVHHLDL